MPYAHFLMAVLATWRLTELMTQDRITQPIRTKLNSYLWSCIRCMSVWCGGWAALMLALAPVTHGISPWVNWPFALAWLYLIQLDWAVGRRMAQRGRELKVTVAPSGQWQMQSELSQPEMQNIITTLARQFQPQPASAQQVNGEVQ